MLETMSRAFAERNKNIAIACSYINNTEQIQIVRVTDIQNWFEKTLLPGQEAKFEAKCNSYLEVYTAKTLSDLFAKISIKNLSIKKGELYERSF